MAARERGADLPYFKVVRGQGAAVNRVHPLLRLRRTKVRITAECVLSARVSRQRVRCRSLKPFAYCDQGRRPAMSDQEYLTSSELADKYPKIFPKSRLDLWARKRIGLPFSQPGGPGGVRIYCLSNVLKVLSESAVKIQPIHRSSTVEIPSKSPQISDQISNSSKKKKGKIGFGLAARTPAKRGPKPQKEGASS